MSEGDIILNVHMEAVPGREQDLERELRALSKSPPPAGSPVVSRTNCIATRRIPANSCFTKSSRARRRSTST